MRAVRCQTYGPIEGLEVEEIERPEPGPGQVRIKVEAMGLNFADLLMVQGLYQVRPEVPFTPGVEFSGTVDAVGEGARLPQGMRVAGICEWGAWAEHVVVDAQVVIPIPESMSFEHAAAFAVTYGTSHVALWRRARLQPGESLLVHGASGGVGSTAVELGKLMGARVLATASTPAKREAALERGADVAIDYTQPDWRAKLLEATDGAGADVIYDPVGGDVFDTSLRCLAWEGRLVTIGYASGRIPEVAANLLLVKNASVLGLYWGKYAQKDPGVLMQSFQTLLGWYASGDISPLIHAETFGLSEISDALATLRDRRAVGKVVVKP